MKDLQKFRWQIITQLDLISKKYADTLYTTRSRDCLHQDLLSLYKTSVEPLLGERLGKEAFKGALVEYCGFAYGVTVFEGLFSDTGRDCIQ